MVVVVFGREVDEYTSMDDYCDIQTMEVGETRSGDGCAPAATVFLM